MCCYEEVKTPSKITPTCQHLFIDNILVLCYMPCIYKQQCFLLVGCACAARFAFCMQISRQSNVLRISRIGISKKNFMRLVFDGVSVIAPVFSMRFGTTTWAIGNLCTLCPYITPGVRSVSARRPGARRPGARVERVQTEIDTTRVCLFVCVC